ncbi:ATP-binding protein, partial [Streptosporangium sp. NPDC049376]
EKDWGLFGRQAVEFHLRNARAWANRATGEDLAAQIDPEFVFGPTRVSLQR